MRPFVVALLAWTAIVIALLFFYPTGYQPVSCAAPVGIGPSQLCLANTAAVGQVWWTHETLPLLIWLAAGYLGIVALRLARLRRSRA